MNRPVPLFGMATILLVEDEDFVREVTSQVLRGAGYVVLRARNADEAVAAFHTHAERIGLLLTDVIMPGKRGTELAAELKALCPTMKTMLMSGYPDVPAGEVPPGMYYLPKPFSAGMLISKIREVLCQDGDRAEDVSCAAGSL